MNEARRRAVLDALGIERYVPRVDGPLAAARVVPAGSADAPAIAVRSQQARAVAGAGLAVADADAAVASMDWDELERTVASCTRCGLAATRTRTVFGVGDRSARWLVVGEAPGEEEDQRGEPFVGRAGQLLDSMLRALGLVRGRGVYIANVLKSRPPGNRDPKPREVEACLPYLQRQVALIRPRIILCVGRVAAQNLLRTETPIGRLRGRTHAIEPFGIPVVVTYHPSYLLRSPGEKRKVWTDLLYAKEIAGGHGA